MRKEFSSNTKTYHIRTDLNMKSICISTTKFSVEQKNLLLAVKLTKLDTRSDSSCGSTYANKFFKSIKIMY